MSRRLQPPSTRQFSARLVAAVAWVVAQAPLARVIASVIVATAWAPEAPAARPFTVDDMLRQSSFGATAIDPGGRWLLFEERGPYDRLPRYDRAYNPSVAFARLRWVDLKHSGPAEPLLADDPVGLVLGPFSPSGRRLALYRLRDRVWELGIVALPERTVRWLPITPLEQGRGRTVQWRGDSELLVIARTDTAPPEEFRSAWVTDERLTAAWSAAAGGESALGVLGSGRYVGVRPRAVRRVLSVAAADGQVTELARGEFFDLELSPDQRRVAILERGADLQPRGDRPVRGVAGSETEASHLAILDLATRQIRRSSRWEDLLPQLLTWSPDGLELLGFARRAGDVWPSGRFLRIRADTGAAQTLGEGLAPELDLNPVTVRAAWLGSDPIVFARASIQSGAAGRADWYRLGPTGPKNLTRRLPAPSEILRTGEPGGVTLLAGGRLWRIDRDGHTRRLGTGLMRAAQRDPRGTRGARIAGLPATESWFLETTTGGERLTGIDARGGSTPFGPILSGPIMTATARGLPTVVQSVVSPSGVERLMLLQAGAAPRQIAELNVHLAATDPLRLVPVAHSGPAGEPLTSWLALPSVRRPDGLPPPLLVRPYLGRAHPTPPRDLPLEEGFFVNLRMLTGHGYAVLVPSLPSPPGGLTEPAVGLAERLEAIERAAAQTPGLSGAFDPARRALIGWSFGGYSVMAAITQTHRYRAAVALDGISDLTAYWSHLSLERALSPEDGYGSNWSTGTVESTQPQMGVPPWADPARYQRNSPLLQADRIETPLMLVHGWRDSVPIAGSEAMFSALFRQGKDALFVTYWGADHHVASPGDVRDVWARTFDFLDAHLRSSPP